jgi:ATP-dependent RNA helicase DOB1
VLQSELSCMKRVLRRLGFLSQQDIVSYKGKVACEVSAGDELVIAELVFNGDFEGLSKEEVCAVLSMFVCDEGGKDDKVSVKDEKLGKKCAEVLDVARRVWRVMSDSKIQIDEVRV